MPLLDQVRKLEQQVIERLKELEPLTREYAQLRKVAQRLGLNYLPRGGSGDAADEPSPVTTPAKPAKRSAAKQGAARSTTARKSAAKPRKAATGRGGRPAARQKAASPTTAARRSTPGRTGATRPGQRADDVLRVATENPGITVREIGTRIGVDPTGLYRVANRLIADGRLRKDGTRLFPVDGASSPRPPAEAGAATEPGAGDAAPPSSAAAGPEATREAGTETPTEG